MDIREQYAYLKPQPIVWLAIVGSAGLHFVLVGLVVIGGLLEERYVPLKDKAIITRLVSKGKKLPDDWLPHKNLRQAAPPPPPRSVAPKPAEAAVQPEPPKPSKPTKVDYSTDMSSALASLAGQEEGDSRYEQQGDPEGVTDGEALIKQKGDAYLTKVYKAVKATYEVPELITERERMFLHAVVILYLDEAGKIKNLKFEKQSGNALFDSAVERAIRRAAPFPPPPEELVERYSRAGIGIPFRASKM